jgi:hypothetical protein
MKIIRAALLVAAVAASSFTFVGVSAGPAIALCKYGGPHCVNPNPNFDYQMPELIYLPEDSWIDPDCKYYGNCH